MIIPEPSVTGTAVAPEPMILVIVPGDVLLIRTELPVLNVHEEALIAEFEREFAYGRTMSTFDPAIAVELIETTTPLAFETGSLIVELTTIEVFELTIIADINTSTSELLKPDPVPHVGTLTVNTELFASYSVRTSLGLYEFAVIVVLEFK